MTLFNSFPYLFYSDTRFTDRAFALAWGDVDNDGINELLVAPFTITATDQPVFFTYTGSDFSDKNIVISDGGFPDSTGAGFEIFDIDGDGRQEVLFFNGSDQTLAIWKYSDGALRHQPGATITGFSDVAAITDISVARISDKNYLFAAHSALVQVVIYNLSDPTAAPTVFTPSGAPQISGVGVRDIDCDGSPEMALFKYGTSQIQFFRLADHADLTSWSDLDTLSGNPSFDLPLSIVFATIGSACRFDLVVTDQSTSPANIAVYPNLSNTVFKNFKLTLLDNTPISGSVVCCQADIVASWTVNNDVAPCSDNLGYVTLTRPGSSTITLSDTSSVTFSFSDCQVGPGTITFFRQCSCCSDMFDSFFLPLMFVQATVDAGSDQTISPGGNTVVGIGSAKANVSYSWSPADGVSDVNAFPTMVSPSNTTTYTVIAQSLFASNCAASDSVTITVIGSSDCSPVVNAGSDQIVCAGTLVTLGLGSAEPNVTYQWSPQTGIISPNQFPTAAFICSDTTFTVVASRTNVSDCFASDRITFTTSDCGCGCQQSHTIFSQSCKKCPSVPVSIKHKTVGSTLNEFFSSDGSQIHIKDNCFISSYTPVKKNIGVNKSFGSDLGFGYVCYTYNNGLTVVRQENGDIILVNNGDINIDSPIDLTNAFHFGDWISQSDLVSSDKKQPDLIIMSNKGSININQNVKAPGLVTCMAPNGHVHVASGKIVQSANNRVIIMASDANHGSGTVTAAITDNTGGTPSGSMLTISDLTDGFSVSDTIRIVTSDNVVITNNATLTKNLEIITPGTVTTANITCPGKNISIIAGHIHISDFDTSNTSNSDNADGGNITLISQNEIICRNLSADGGGGNAGGNDGNGSTIALIAGTAITTTSISANGGGLGGVGGEGGSCGEQGGPGGTGGVDCDGGIITIIAGTAITTTSISANGGGLGGVGGAGGSACYGLGGGDGGAGGSGGADGDGGTITIIGGSSITATAITNTGGGKGGTGGENQDKDKNVASGADGNGGDGGTITLIACGDITIPSASVAEGPGSGSITGKILIKSYGAISGIINTPNTQILKMRNLQIFPPNKISSSSGSDITFSLTILNQGFGIEPAGKIDISAVSNSNDTFAQLPNSDIFFPALLPGQSNQISVNILNLNAGNFEYTLSATDRCLQSKTLKVTVPGQTSLSKTTIELLGSYLLFDLLLPSDFIDAFGIKSDHQKLCSDIKAYLQDGPKTVGLNIREQSDVIIPRPESEPAKPNSAKSERGSILITAAGEDGFVFRISDCTSDSLIIEYSDALTPFVKKKMQVIGFETLAVTFEQKETRLGIINVLPVDQSIKFTDTASFNIVVQNKGPADVSDAFIKITSNLGETFSDKQLGFLPSDGTLISDTITFMPTTAGSHLFSFEIESTLVINTNIITNVVSDIGLDVCQLEIVSTNAGPIIALPNLPFTVPFDLTKTGGNPTTHITAKISDIIHYQSDFATGSHTLIIDAPGAFVDNTIVKLTASDGTCYDEDHHPIQVIDSLSDAASLLGTTVSDIKNAIDSNQIMQTIEDLLATTNLIPSGFPSDLIDRLWDTPVFKEILPLLLNRPGGVFDVGSLIKLVLFGSFVDITLIPNPTLMLYLAVNLIPLPTSDPVSILETICNGLSAHSDIPNTAAIHISGYSDFFSSDALILNNDHAVTLSYSDNKFFFAAADEAFLLSLLPFNASPYQLCYSDNTQQICKQFSDKTGSFDVVLMSDNTFVPPPATSATPKSHLETLFKALFLALVGGAAILIALKNKN